MKYKSQRPVDIWLCPFSVGSTSSTFTPPFTTESVLAISTITTALTTKSGLAITSANEGMNYDSN